MNNKSTIPLVLLLLTCLGCQLPQIIRPMRLYNLTDGRMFEVFLQSTQSTGKLVSAKSDSEHFQGEFIIYDRMDPSHRPSREDVFFGGTRSHIPENTNFAELYGFGKETNVRPVGSAILVGTKGTVIEVVFYKVASDMNYGDGVARDNKGFFYRVFLTEETR